MSNEPQRIERRLREILDQCKTLLPDDDWRDLDVSDAVRNVRTARSTASMGIFFCRVGDVAKAAQLEALAQRSLGVGYMQAAQPDWERGQQFTGNKRGESSLKKLLREILNEMGSKTSNAEVWARLDDLAQEGHHIIQEVDGMERVYWKGATGKEQDTGFGRVSNILSDLRKEV